MPAGDPNQACMCESRGLNLQARVDMWRTDR